MQSAFFKFNWGKNDQKEQEKGTSSNSLLNVLTSNGVTFVSENIAYSDYAEKGVSDNADSAYELTATNICYSLLCIIISNFCCFV